MTATNAPAADLTTDDPRELELRAAVVAHGRWPLEDDLLEQVLEAAAAAATIDELLLAYVSAAENANEPAYDRWVSDYYGGDASCAWSGKAQLRSGQPARGQQCVEPARIRRGRVERRDRRSGDQGRRRRA